MRYANTEKVTAAWLATLPGITSAMVGGTVPSNNGTWAASGFIELSGLGGNADLDFPVDHPIVNLKFWTVDPDSGLPPWNRAADLGEIVKDGCLSNGVGVILDLPTSDQNARILSVYMKQTPRRMYGDVGDYACFVAELAVHWAVY